MTARWAAAVLALMLALGPAAPAGAEAAKPRVTSINMCTDQLLLDLADPEQILGLSPYAADGARSWIAERARRHPALSGTAEEILVLKPDLVVSGTFGRGATHDMLRRFGYRLETFDPVRSVDEARAQILRMGQLIGQPERAALRAEALDAAVLKARAAALARPLRVLPLQRRGWVSGGDTLITSLMGTLGLRNAALDLGLTAGGHVDLEAVVALRPDLLLVAREPGAEDQGLALLQHPSLVRVVPLDRRLVVSERLTVCGGPMLAETLQAIAAELDRVNAAQAP
jgi:iron complex transport system substrate-binding protein